MTLLREKQAKLAEVEAKIAELQKTYDDSMAEKQKLERNISTTAARLKRAAKLTTALGDEQVRWSETVEVCSSFITQVIIDQIAQAILVYRLAMSVCLFATILVKVSG